MKTVDRRLKTADRRTVQPREKTADPVYLTPEHKAWAIGVKQRAGWKCERCKTPTARLIADHIKEIQDGGDALSPENGQALCASCHGIKTAEERAKRSRGL